MDIENPVNESTTIWLEALRLTIAQDSKYWPVVSEWSHGDCPLASIVVLNFNGEAIIQRCITHLLAQTYPAFEIVVVDNGSSDRSLALLRNFAETGQIVLVESSRNLGVAGGRNLGKRRAAGDVIAFIDNDGYAEPHWLQNAIEKLLSSPRIGAVASMVFFNRNKIILNGAGGRANVRGYAQDHCFNNPLEFAEPPDRVHYPMGCGMVLRRESLDAIGDLDDHLMNYFDDVELGTRVWRRGYQVVVCPNAWVDHDFSYSDKINKNKTLLYERGRIRNLLKYFPLKSLIKLLPSEVRTVLRYLKTPGTRTIPLQVWIWNISHVISALKIRRQYRCRKPPEWNQVECRPWYPVVPNNHAFSPDLSNLGSRVELGTLGDHRALNFGWFAPEQAHGRHYRRSAAAASLLLRLGEDVRALKLLARSDFEGLSIHVSLRRSGSVVPEWESSLQLTEQWDSIRWPLDLAAGDYELMLQLEDGPSGQPADRSICLSQAMLLPASADMCV